MPYCCMTPWLSHRFSLFSVGSYVLLQHLVETHASKEGTCRGGDNRSSTCVPRIPSPWRLAAHVSNDHGEALLPWLDAAAAVWFAERVVPTPLTVLHVDAHGDLNAPSDILASSSLDRSGWLHNSTQRLKLDDSADLANFQLSAVWCGLVERIIWIKQGTGEAQHLVYNLRREEHTTSFVLDAPVQVDVTELRLGYACESYVANTSNADVCFFVHEVYEEDMLQAPLAETLFGLLRDRLYILDVDLDFFVWQDMQLDAPGQLPWVDLTSESGFPIAECGELIQSCWRWTDPDCKAWRNIQDVLLEIVGQSMKSQHFPDGSTLQKHEDSIHASCRSAVERWIASVVSLQSYHMESLSVLYAAEWILAIHQAHYPFARQDQGKLTHQLGLLEKFLSALTSYPPVLITVARSVDVFTRLCDAPILEERLLKLLLQVWGVKGFERQHNPFAPEPLLAATYAPGTSPLDNLASAVKGIPPCALFW